MITGIEIAGVILGSFPLVIHALECYGEGLETMQEWVRFRTDFNGFLSDFIRQQIFFRQHIEDLLSPVVDSEYQMGCMLDDPNHIEWKDPRLEAKLKKRLPGMHEYETYMATVSAILAVLQKVQKKLDVTDDDKARKPFASILCLLRVSFEFKRIAYVLDKKRRARLMNALEKYNNELQRLLGNSDRLEPTRRKRKFALPAFFEQFRKQASSLHNAICRSLQCECSSFHSTHLLLPRGSAKDLATEPNELTEPLKLTVYFTRNIQSQTTMDTITAPENDWYAADIEMAEASESDTLAPSMTSISLNSATTLVRDPKDEVRPGRKVSFQHNRRMSTSSVPKDAVEIQDLCAALLNYDKDKPHLGYLRGGDSCNHTIYHATSSSSPPVKIQERITLAELIQQAHESISSSGFIGGTLRRQERLEIALTMAKVILRLYQCPWLKEEWSKEDIYFFRDAESKVHPETISLVSEFYSTRHPSQPEIMAPSEPHLERKRARALLLSLGILILELWFNKPLESCSFWTKFLGPDGKENEFTKSNTAQKWQERALEEGGVDLDSLTHRCIHCDFGTARQDLNDEELRRAVYDEVVQPLERILTRYE
ncbi:hypothetical protein CC78DRAFT_465821 [Lojkania enalia]|uniref:DUF7580 domain-containing protein n=1 Tax=Lojkania enalia TaxID=147567 RepID=A0A9P4K848_9PLEO|nr:hypothetical protein CC78DRAFT_465821 [Didymosphaeria enalia]